MGHWENLILIGYTNLQSALGSRITSPTKLPV